MLPSYLRMLIQACPWPKHATAYARMIRADRARRTLRIHARRLAQVIADTTGPSPAATVLAPLASDYQKRVSAGLSCQWVTAAVSST